MLNSYQIISLYGANELGNEWKKVQKYLSDFYKEVVYNEQYEIYIWC